MRYVSCLAVALAAAPLLPVRAQDTVRRVRINDIEMAYRVKGAGEPLLLLHGFGGCGLVWDPVTERLAAGYRLIIPDLRGHGGSTNPRGTFTHRQSAEDVAALLDHLALPRVRAMGISTGGMTLLHLATRHPERLEAMVLIGATSYFPEEARAIMRQAGQALREPSPRELSCTVRGVDQWRELQAQFSAFQTSYDDMNFTPPLLGTIKVRTLIVHGDRDRFFPVDIPVGMYKAIPGSQLWILPGGGHVPIFGPNTERFAQVALEFLRRPTEGR